MMKKITILFAMAALLFSCSNDDGGDSDTTKPVILLNEPEDHEEFAQGSTIHLDGKITDETALSEMRIDIHLGEGHDHGGKTSSEWDYEETISISGREYDFHKDIAIPTDADTGEYHVLVYAIDKAGNNANFASVEIEIVQP